MTIGRTFCLLVAALCTAAVGYAASYWYPLPRPGSQPADIASPEPVENPTRIEAQGRIEPVSGTLTVGAVPGEEIVQLNAHVGQTVKRDAILAVLGSQKLRSEERVLAEQQLAKAQRQFEAEQSLGKLRHDVALISQEQAAAREKEIPTEESIRVGEQRETLASARLEKLEQLKKDPQTQDAISDAELEQQRLLVRQIQVELEEHRTKLEAARQTQGFAQRVADLDVAMAKLTQENLVKASPLPLLEQSVKLARLTEEASLVRAPCNGTILEVYARQGERVANTPILQLGDLRQMVCIAEVHEASLKELEIKKISDDPDDGKLVPARDYLVSIRSAALEQDLKGKITEIGRLIGAPAMGDPNPLAQSDRRTVKVRIELDEVSTETARRFVHLQVNVTIHLTDAK
jgi:HlyD family secretion protein